MTGNEVYTPTKVASPELNRLGSAFSRQDKAIFLLSETLCPSVELEVVTSLCVIHMGWPFNETQCELPRLFRPPHHWLTVRSDNTQIKTHQTRDNVLVAFSKDKDLYPSGSHITTQTISWPVDEKSLRALVLSTTTPLESALVNIPSAMKGRVYTVSIIYRILSTCA